MLGADKTITLAHYTGSGYVCTSMHGCSWIKKRVTASDAQGIKVGHVYICQIPEDGVIAEPAIGDYIILGAVAITTRADIDKYDNFRVTAISDNRTMGILPHLAVSGT